MCPGIGPTALWNLWRAGLIRNGEWDGRQCLMVLTPAGRSELEKIVRAVSPSSGSDAAPNYSAQARRFHDKADEADQLADLATLASRRETLSHIASSYRRTAAQLDALAMPAGEIGPDRKRDG